MIDDMRRAGWNGLFAEVRVLLDQHPDQLIVGHRVAGADDVGSAESRCGGAAYPANTTDRTRVGHGARARADRDVDDLEGRLLAIPVSFDDAIANRVVVIGLPGCDPATRAVAGGELREAATNEILVRRHSVAERDDGAASEVHELRYRPARGERKILEQAKGADRSGTPTVNR